MPQYDYKCSVCNCEFTVECPISEHKSVRNCGECYTQDGAKQIFKSDTMPNVKVWDNPILKDISYD